MSTTKEQWDEEFCALQKEIEALKQALRKAHDWLKLVECQDEDIRDADLDRIVEEIENLIK